MKLKVIVLLSIVVFVLSCKKSEPEPIVPVDVKHKISGVVSTPSGTPLNGVTVTFDDGTNRRQVITNSSGQYQFVEFGEGDIDLEFDGKPFRYLNMRNRDVDFGGRDRTYDKMMAPWEIEEIDFLTANFIDSLPKSYSLVKYKFDEMKMDPSDFKNLSSSVYFDSYETTFTAPQNEVETNVTVSVYSMPKNTGYSIDNHDKITYSDVISWKKILTVSTTTAPIGTLEPVILNLAAAYANHADYDHSGTIVMISEEINETFGVTSDVDLLEIRLPYGDDFEFQL